MERYSWKCMLATWFTQAHALIWVQFVHYWVILYLASINSNVYLWIPLSTAMWTWVKMRRRGKLGEKKDCGRCRLREILVHFTYMWLRRCPYKFGLGHSPHRSHDMLNACACILVWHALCCFNDLAIVKIFSYLLCLYTKCRSSGEFLATLCHRAIATGPVGPVSTGPLSGPQRSARAWQHG